MSFALESLLKSDYYDNLCWFHRIFLEGVDMSEMDSMEVDDEQPVPGKRKMLIAGSIALVTSVLAGTAYVASVTTANACSAPPCPSPAPAPVAPPPPKG